MPDHRALLTSLYDAISRQDVDGVLATLHPEIDWPDTINGGRVKGLPAMRDYWTRQFQLVRPYTAMIDYAKQPDGSIQVRLNYLVRALDGAIWTDEVAGNLFRFKDGLIVFADWT